MEIIADRGSVCMGDDITEHKREYTFSDDATFQEVIDALNKDRFFASVSGNNVVWVLATEDDSRIYAYYTKTGRVTRRKDRLSEFHWNGKLVFRYFYSPERWKEILERDFADVDGQRKECKYCDKLGRT